MASNDSSGLMDWKYNTPPQDLQQTHNTQLTTYPKVPVANRSIRLVDDGLIPAPQPLERTLRASCPTATFNTGGQLLDDPFQISYKTPKNPFYTCPTTTTTARRRMFDEFAEDEQVATQADQRIASSLTNTQHQYVPTPFGDLPYTQPFSAPVVQPDRADEEALLKLIGIACLVAIVWAFKTTVHTSLAVSRIACNGVYATGRYVHQNRHHVVDTYRATTQVGGRFARHNQQIVLKTYRATAQVAQSYKRRLMEITTRQNIDVPNAPLEVLPSSPPASTLRSIPEPALSAQFSHSLHGSPHTPSRNSPHISVHSSPGSYPRLSSRRRSPAGATSARVAWDAEIEQRRTIRASIINKDNAQCASVNQLANLMMEDEVVAMHLDEETSVIKKGSPLSEVSDGNTRSYGHDMSIVSLGKDSSVGAEANGYSDDKEEDEIDISGHYHLVSSPAFIKDDDADIKAGGCQDFKQEDGTKNLVHSIVQDVKEDGSDREGLFEGTEEYDSDNSDYSLTTSQDGEQEDGSHDAGHSDVASQDVKEEDEGDKADLNRSTLQDVKEDEEILEIKNEDSKMTSNPTATPSKMGIPSTPSPPSLERLYISGRRTSNRQRARERELEIQRAEQARLRAEEQARKDAEAAAAQARREAAAALERERREDLLRQKRGSRRAPKAKLIQPLPPEWSIKVDAAMASASVNRELATTSNGTKLTRKDFGTLLPQAGRDSISAWLNDEIVAAYLQMTVDYGLEKTGHKRGQTPRHHTFNTFFYKNLRDKGPDSIRRWASKAKIGGKNLLDAEYVFIPVHEGAHWTLLVVCPMRRTIEYFDSYHGNGKRHTDRVKTWLKQELGSEYNANEWTVWDDAGSPTQANAKDCGVFVATTAKMIMLGYDPKKAYDMDDLPCQRMRMAAELINGGFTGDFEPVMEE
ncbi:MAG: hypothetical protein Q9187_006451 [Circinaria calcarea]